jgi:hypothetical protein
VKYKRMKFIYVSVYLKLEVIILIDLIH